MFLRTSPQSARRCCELAVVINTIDEFEGSEGCQAFNNSIKSFINNPPDVDTIRLLLSASGHVSPA